MKVLDRDQFWSLYTAFRNQLYKDYTKQHPDSIAKDQHVFGRGNHKNAKYTARYFMYNIPRIKNYLKEKYFDSKKPNKVDFSNHINPRYMYDLKKSTYDKGKDEILLKELYTTIIPYYFNCENFKEFFENYSDEVNWIKYTGYYHSVGKNSIETYEIKIRFDGQELEGHPNHAQFKVKEKFFHDYAPAPEYSGYAYILRDRLHLVLLSKDADSKMTIDRLKMVFDSGGNPKSLDAMKGSILAVSATHGNPILSLETVLIKDSYKIKLIKNGESEEVKKEREFLKRQRGEEILNVHRYLNLHRNTFWIRPETFDLEGIYIKRSINVDAIDYLVGVYRVWRFDGNFDIVQSKLIINNDYSSVCFNAFYDNLHFNKQVCLLTVNKIKTSESKTLCISTHPFKGTGTISYIILKLGNKYEWRKVDNPKLLDGSISFVGVDNIAPSQSTIIFKWEGHPEDEINLKPDKFSIDEAKSQLENRAMLNKLIKATQAYNLPDKIINYNEMAENLTF